jgi:hypothetical protein
MDQEVEDKKEDIKKSLATSRYELELLKFLQYDKFYWSHGRNSKQDVIIDDEGIESKFEVKAQTQEGFMNIEFRQKNINYNKGVNDPLRWVKSGIDTSDSDWYVLFVKGKEKDEYTKVYMFLTSVLRGLINDKLEILDAKPKKSTKRKGSYIDDDSRWTKELKRLAPLIEAHNPNMEKRLGITVPFEFDRFKPFSNEYKPERRNNNMFIDDDENPELERQRKIDPFVVVEFKMTKDIEFYPKNNRPPYVRPNRGIIAVINIQNFINFCNENEYDYFEFDGGNLNDNNDAITKHFLKCVVKDGQQYAEFTSEENDNDMTIDELMNLECDKHGGGYDSSSSSGSSSSSSSSSSSDSDNGLEFLKFISKK